jgi:hypothetical protein
VLARHGPCVPEDPRSTIVIAAPSTLRQADPRRVPQRRSDDGARHGAERQPDAELPRPLLDRAGHRPVDADGGQQGRGDGEESDEQEV